MQSDLDVIEKNDFSFCSNLATMSHYGIHTLIYFDDTFSDCLEISVTVLKHKNFTRFGVFDAESDQKL